MYMLCEIRDNTPLESLTLQTALDFDFFKDLDQAIIYMEPENCSQSDLNTFFIIDDDGKFYRIIPHPKGWADAVEFRSDPALALRMLAQYASEICK